jgi:small-conductance mechanosensitive channel
MPTEGTAHEFVPLLAGGLVFWVAVAISVAASIETLGMPSVSGLVRSAARYLPKILIAALTVFLGMLAGDFVQARVRRMGTQAGLSRADAVGRGLRGVTIALALIIAIEQLEVGSEIVLYGMAIILASAFGAASLAFGLGARTAVGNIIAVHYLRRSYRVGDAVRIGNIEGEIAAITRTAVLLETPDGRVEVPASKFSEEISVRLSERGP